MSHIMGKEVSKHMQTAMVQVSLCIHTILPEAVLCAYISGRLSENFSQQTRHLALL